MFRSEVAYFFPVKTYNKENIEDENLKRLKEFSVTDIARLRDNPKVIECSLFSTDEDSEDYRGGVTWSNSSSF